MCFFWPHGRPLVKQELGLLPSNQWGRAVSGVCILDDCGVVVCGHSLTTPGSVSCSFWSGLVSFSWLVMTLVLLWFAYIFFPPVRTGCLGREDVLPFLQESSLEQLLYRSLRGEGWKNGTGKLCVWSSSTSPSFPLFTCICVRACIDACLYIYECMCSCMFIYVCIHV